MTAFGQSDLQSKTIAGLSQKVTVKRDGRSIPYISAENEKDLYFAQGYITASDRLWQMDLLRRVARGETAEIFGKAALEEDKRWRRYGFAGISEESLQYLSPQLREALDSYSAGVNAFIATLDDSSLPVEFQILRYRPREWRPADTLVIGKILADALSSTWRLDLIKAAIGSLPKEKFNDLVSVRSEYDVVLLGKDGPLAKKRSAGKVSRAPVSEGLLEQADFEAQLREASLAKVGLFAEDLAASNNWVISGKRTADGKPLLANDPHLQPAAPGIWYMAFLESPGMRVSGVTFPGVPGIVLGHNDHIAWGATNVGPDVQDLYLETVDEKGKFKSPTGWDHPRIRKEQIMVRTNILKPDTEPVSFDVEESRNGVVVVEENGKKYSLKWTARDPHNNDFGAFFLLNRAKDWNDFNSALQTYRGASQNFVYADDKGHIGWHIAGAIPLRSTGDGSLPYDGATDDGKWIGNIPYEELPWLFDPPAGFIITANQRTVGTDYKYPQLVRDIAPPWRARRLYELISKEPKATMDTVNAAQHDVFNIPLSNLAKEILKAGSASQETVDLLKFWDGKMVPDSRAALLVNEIRNCIATKIADANKPAPLNVIRERILDRAVRERSSIWLPKEFADYPSLIKACDAEAAGSLTKRFGDDRTKWVWGKISASRFGHPLAAAPLIGQQFVIPAVGLEGSGQTPNVGSFVSMRFIASPPNWDITRHVIPLGESGDPRSEYFKDQFDAWKGGSPLSFPFSEGAISKAARVTITLTPK